MQSEVSRTPPERTEKSTRLHYLDWMYVAATLGVFIFHAVHPFDPFDWHIKNAEQSMLVTVFVGWVAPWGMPLFFLMAGTASRFSLRRRTGRQFAVERVKRLLIPFVAGAILFTPIQVYLEWVHKGRYEGSFLGFIPTLIDSRLGPDLHELFSAPLGAYLELLNPRVFGSYGFHLWFLGFLFLYSLIALPLLLWFKKDAGQRVIDRLAGIWEKRGGLLLSILPLLVVQLALRPFFLEEHNWAGFCFMLVFYIYGHILFADRRFALAIRRDRRLALVGGIISTLAISAIGIAGVFEEWMANPSLLGFYLLWSVWTLSSWCWSIFALYLGMRSLDFHNRWLDYGREASMPFFLFHQPVIIVIAFFVVQWDAGVSVKLPVVVLGSFIVTLGVYQLIVRRIGLLRALFGMKPSR